MQLVAQNFNQGKLSVVSEHLRFLGPKSTRPGCNKPVDTTMLITPHFSFNYVRYKRCSPLTQ